MIFVIGLSACATGPASNESPRASDPGPASAAPVRSEAVATSPAAVEDDCVCSLSASELSERERWLASFASGAIEVRDLPDGFESRFPSDWGPRLLELVEKERACCSSLTFELRFEPESGPIGLRCHGPTEAVAFLRARLIPKPDGPQ